MKLKVCLKIALALALIGSAAAQTLSFPNDERIVLSRAGDPSQWG